MLPLPSCQYANVKVLCCSLFLHNAYLVFVSLNTILRTPHTLQMLSYQCISQVLIFNVIAIYLRVTCMFCSCSTNIWSHSPCNMINWSFNPQMLILNKNVSTSPSFMIILVHVQGLINILITILIKIHTFSFDPCSNLTNYNSWNYFIYYVSYLVS